MPAERPSPRVIALQAVALVVVIGFAIFEAPQGNWDLGLLLVLFAFAAFSDLTAITTNAQIKISGSFLALVLAMVFLGGTPAAVLGVMTIAVGNNGLAMIGAPIFTQYLFSGSLLVVAVALGGIGRRYAAS